MIITTATSGWRSADFPKELEPVHLRHPKVAEREHERVLLELLERLDPVRRFDAVKPVPAHEMRHDLPKARLVVDDQTVWRMFRVRVIGPSSVTTLEMRGYLPHTSETKSIGMTRVFDEDLTAGFGTRAIHAGQRPDPLAGAIMTPIYLTSTYVQDGLGQNKGYEYARGKNPTREAFERNVAALENGLHGFAFASGMGCLDSIMKLFRAGDHVICAENVYGGTFRLFDKILQHMGLSFSYVDTRDPQRVADAMTAATRAVLLETPSNPLMRLTDIAAVADIAHRERRASDRRQYLRLTVFPTPARLGCRHRLPLDDEVPERAQRHDRRLRRGSR